MSLEQKIKSLLEAAEKEAESTSLLSEQVDPAIDAEIEKMNESFKITPFVAKKILDAHGGIDKNFFQLSHTEVSSLLDHAKENGYKKSQYAPGSTARMFHQHLKRLASNSQNAAPDATNEGNSNMTIDHVNALVEGEKLSEEFKVKAATILEAAINEGVASEIERLDEEHAIQLSEAVKSVQDEMVKNVEGFMDLMIKEWTIENQVAIESGMKLEMLENFVDGIKGLFEKTNVIVPEGKRDLIGEQESMIVNLTSKLDEQTLALENMQRAINEEKSARIIESVGKTLTMTEVEKFNSLCENIEFTTDEEFETKVKTIKENYFPKTKAAYSMDVDTPMNNINEGVMSHYVAALANPLTFTR